MVDSVLVQYFSKVRRKGAGTKWHDASTVGEKTGDTKGKVNVNRHGVYIVCAFCFGASKDDDIQAAFQDKRKDGEVFKVYGHLQGEGFGPTERHVNERCPWLPYYKAPTTQAASPDQVIRRAFSAARIEEEEEEGPVPRRRIVLGGNINETAQHSYASDGSKLLLRGALLASLVTEDEKRILLAAGRESAPEYFVLATGCWLGDDETVQRFAPEGTGTILHHPLICETYSNDNGDVDLNGVVIGKCCRPSHLRRGVVNRSDEALRRLVVGIRWVLTVNLLLDFRPFIYDSIAADSAATTATADVAAESSAATATTDVAAESSAADTNSDDVGVADAVGGGEAAIADLLAFLSLSTGKDDAAMGALP